MRIVTVQVDNESIEAILDLSQVDRVELERKALLWYQSHMQEQVNKLRETYGPKYAKRSVKGQTFRGTRFGVIKKVKEYGI